MPPGAKLTATHLDPMCETRAEFVAPAPDRFIPTALPSGIADDNSALEQRVVSLAQAQLKLEIAARRTNDDE
jgi:hypothetical protein